MQRSCKDSTYIAYSSPLLCHHFLICNTIHIIVFCHLYYLLIIHLYFFHLYYCILQPSRAPNPGAPQPRGHGAGVARACPRRRLRPGPLRMAVPRPYFPGCLKDFRKFTVCRGFESYGFVFFIGHHFLFEKSIAFTTLQTLSPLRFACASFAKRKPDNYDALFLFIRYLLGIFYGTNNFSELMHTEREGLS